MKYQIIYLDQDHPFKGFYNTVNESLYALSLWLKKHSTTLESSSERIQLLRYSQEAYERTLQHRQTLQQLLDSKKKKAPEKSTYKINIDDINLPLMI